jgi:polyadenylate-binding protein
MNQFKLFASGLSPDVDEDTLSKHIERVDKSIRVKTIVIMRDHQTFRSKGFAILEFGNQEECKICGKFVAEKALRALNYTEVLGNELNLCSYRPGGMRDKTSSNLFIKNLPGDTKSVDLYQLFAPFGKIFSAKVKYNPNGTCKGYGYVQYETKEEAEKALEAINDKPYKSTKIAVEHFLASGARPASFMKYNNLFVKNIPKTFTHKELVSLFEPHGEIVSAVVIKESPDAAVNRGFGFVCFKKAEDAKGAEEKLKNLTIEGQSLFICRALPKEERRKQLREERLKAFKDCNLYVKELPEDITDEKLKVAFEEFGKVVSARVMLERRQNLETGETEMKSRGFGFVCFNDKQGASAALIASSSQPILGRMLYVAIAEKKEDRLARITGPFPVPFPGPRPAGMFPMYGIPPYGFTGPFPQPRPRRPRNVLYLPIE